MPYTQAMEYGWALLRMHWDHPDFKEGPQGVRREARSGVVRGTAPSTDDEPTIPTDHEPDARARRGSSSARRWSTSSPSREPVDGFFLHEGEHDAAERRLYRELGERGWLSLAWPVEVGGQRAAAGVRVHPLERDGVRPRRPPAARVRASSPRRSSPTAPTSRRERFLPGLRAGTTFFSLGYSEPEAGSDLGGVRTRAVLRGRRVRAQRREALDVGRPPRRLPVGAVPHRDDREPQPRPHAADRRPPIAGDHDLADPVARRRALQRGPLRRRRGSRREPRRRAGRGLDDDGRVAGDRAPRAVQPQARAARLRGAGRARRAHRARRRPDRARNDRRARGRGGRGRSAVAADAGARSSAATRASSRRRATSWPAASWRSGSPAPRSTCAASTPSCAAR